MQNDKQKLLKHDCLFTKSMCLFYRFTCNRWLGKGVDDGSIERLLVAELLPHDTDTEGMLTLINPQCTQLNSDRPGWMPKLIRVFVVHSVVG